MFSLPSQEVDKDHIALYDMQVAVRVQIEADPQGKALLLHT